MHLQHWIPLEPVDGSGSLSFHAPDGLESRSIESRDSTHSRHSRHSLTIVPSPVTACHFHEFSASPVSRCRHLAGTIAAAPRGGDG